MFWAVHITTLHQGTVCRTGRVKPRANGKSLSSFTSGKYSTVFGCWTQFYCWKLRLILKSMISCKAMLWSQRAFISTLEDSLHEEKRSWEAQAAVMSFVIKRHFFFSVREDCLRKWNSINNLGPSQKMDNMFTTHAVTVLKLSSISRLWIKQKKRGVLWMIKPSLDDPLSVPNGLPISNVVKIDWKQTPQP